MQKASARKKHYVEVVVNISREGDHTPLTIVWDDGVRYHVDKVLDHRQAHSTRTGGTGIRYTVRVGGSETFLWREGERWFVEAKVRASLHE